MVVPFVFTLRLVKVFPAIVATVPAAVSPARLIYVCALVPPILCTIPLKSLFCMEAVEEAPRVPLEIIPVTAPEVASLKVIAPPLALPTWLLFIVTELTTAPVFDIPVKPPVVDVEVLPLIILLLILKIPGADELDIHTITLDEATPLITQFKIVLLLIFTVAVLSAVIPWLRIHSKVPLVAALLLVIVLLVIELVNVPVGVATEKSVKIPRNVVVIIPVAPVNEL